MASGRTIKSDKDTHFTGAIAQNAMETETLSGGPISGGQIVAASLQADQDLDWRVLIFADSNFDDTNLDTDSFIGVIEFNNSAAANQPKAFQVGGTNQYYNSTSGLKIPIPGNTSGSVYVALQNTNTTSKNAGATGEVQLTLAIEE